MFFPSFRENLAHSEARGFFIFTPHRLGIPALNRHRKNQVLAQFVLSGMGVLPVNHAQMRVPASKLYQHRKTDIIMARRIVSGHHHV